MFGRREVFSGCHSNIYHKTSRSLSESSVLHIHGVHNGVIMAQRRAKKTRRVSQAVVDQWWIERGATVSGTTGKWLSWWWGWLFWKNRQFPSIHPSIHRAAGFCPTPHPEKGRMTPWRGGPFITGHTLFYLTLGQLESPVTLTCMSELWCFWRTCRIPIKTPRVDPVAMRKRSHLCVIKYLEYPNHLLNDHFSSLANGKCHITLLYRGSMCTQHGAITANLLHVHVSRWETSFLTNWSKDWGGTLIEGAGTLGKQIMSCSNFYVPIKAQLWVQRGQTANAPERNVVKNTS